MDFRPSVQITGDLSGGKRKNGMMAGRLDDGDAASLKKEKKGEKNVFCANKNR